MSKEIEVPESDIENEDANDWPLGPDGADTSTVPEVPEEVDEETEDSTAESINTEQSEVDEPAKPEEPDTRFDKNPRFQELRAKAKEAEEAKAAVEARLAEFERTVAYQKEMIDAAYSRQRQNPQHQRQPIPQQGMPQGQQGMPVKPVPPAEGWQTMEEYSKYQEQLEGYYEAVSDQKARAQVQHYNDNVLGPEMQKMRQANLNMQENMVRTQNEDFDDVMSAAMKDLFVLDAEGKPYSIKNEALLTHLQGQLNPIEATYRYGKMLVSPQQIKERINKGVKEQSQKTIQKLAAKPMGPTRPKTGAGSSSDDSDIGWNDDPFAPGTEEKLAKKGLL